MVALAWHLCERVADEYDEVLPFFSRFGVSIMSALDLRPGCRVLDLGAGRGALADIAAERGSDVDIHDRRATVTVDVPDNETLWRWMMSHGYRAFVEALPVPHRERFRQRVLQLPPYDRTLSRTTSVWSGRKRQV